MSSYSGACAYSGCRNAVEGGPYIWNPLWRDVVAEPVAPKNVGLGARSPVGIPRSVGLCLVHATQLKAHRRVA